MLSKQPGQFGPREVSVYYEPGLSSDVFLEAVFDQLPADAGRTPALPDDRIVHGGQGVFVPKDRGLTLVGDAYRRDLDVVI